MPRIEPLRAPYPSDVEATFDAIMPPGAPPLSLFRTVAKSPRAWAKFRAGSLLDRGPLSLREREILIDRTCALAGCEYEWGVHIAFFAERVGLTEAEVAATVDGGADGADSWTPAERALLRAADALHHRARLSDAQFEALRSHYDDAQILEALQLCGFYRMVAYLANGLDLAAEAGAARFPTSRK
jgi:alkylhydroperoxidase family enzyme